MENVKNSKSNNFDRINRNKYDYSGYADVDYSEFDRHIDDKDYNNFYSANGPENSNNFPKKFKNFTRFNNSEFVDSVLCDKDLNLNNTQSINIKLNKKNLKNNTEKKKILEHEFKKNKNNLFSFVSSQKNKIKISIDKFKDFLATEDTAYVIKSKNKNNVIKKRQNLNFKCLMKYLNLDNDSLIAILQVITGQYSYCFKYIKSNNDCSIILFEDNCGHFFSIPLEKIIYCANLINS